MNEVNDFFENNIKLNKNDTIIAAISGGPDSMLLLKILLDLQANKKFKIVVAHVNHNLREESNQEYTDLKEFCKDYDVIFEYYEIEKRKEKTLTEAEAREIRYNFFDNLAKKYNASYLATAHHGDDLIETIMMRIVRGSSLRGYSGFRRITEKNGYKIIRPLITLTKEEIIEMLKQYKIPYAVDKTNESMEYTRNRYRKNLLPFLKSENENVHLKFKKFGETLSTYHDYIKKVVSKEKKNIIEDEKINIDKFNKLDNVIQRELLYMVLEEIYKDEKKLITDVHIESIFNLLRNKRPNITLMFPNNIQVIKEYNYLYFKNKENVEQYNIELFEETILPNGKKIKFVKEIDNNSNYMTRLNSKEIKLPLYVRTRKEKDVMIVKGINKSKKIKDIFIDEKIPASVRSYSPIVEDSEGNIVWLPGIKKSSFDKKDNEEYDIILHYF